MMIVRIIAFSCALLPLAASAQFDDFGSPSAEVKVRLEQGLLKPGEQSELLVIIDIPRGLHTQSNKPLDRFLIPTTVEVRAQQGATIGNPVYPPGEIEHYEKLGGDLSVYSGRTTIKVPFQVAPDASPGELKFAGTVTYQRCDDDECFPTVKADFQLSAQVLPAAAAYPASRPAVEVQANAGPPVQAAAIEADEADIKVVSVEQYLNQPQAAPWTYGVALGVAVVAGLLFNVMPCVLPVLPLKAIGFYETAQHNRLRSIAFGGVFSIGLISIFVVLGALILAGSVTWGQQFSEPWFIWTIVGILLVMTLGLFGLFSVSLPTSVYSFTPRHDTYTGNYLFGMLTAVLATPCTAPLLPGVLAFALTQPGLWGGIIVVAVGVGMALPYFLLSAFPEVARRFPRSGPWPELFKQMMAFLLLGSAVYFGAGRLLEGTTFYWALVPVGIAAGIFLVVRTRMLAPRTRPVVIAAVFGLLLAVGPALLAARMNGLLGGATLNWQHYSAAAFRDQRKQNNAVLLKFTANWCTNCQYIEGKVFRDAKVVQALEDRDVVPMKVDLSTENLEGNQMLRRFNPAGGIPLTVVYLPKERLYVKFESVYEGQTLLEVLQKSARAQ